MGWRGVLLLASLVLNGLLIGFIVGDFARPIRAVMSLGTLTEHYPVALRQAIRSEIIADRAAIRADLGTLSEARVALVAGMRDPNASPETLALLAEAVRAATTAGQARLQEATIRAVLAAPPEVRAAIADPGDRAGDLLGD